MRNIGDIWGVSENTLRTLVESRYRRAQNASGSDDARAMPGDAILPRADQVVQRTVEINAPPEAVWPWICQLYRGGGVYGWAGVETDRCRSADYLLPNTQPPRIGDRFDQFLTAILSYPGRAWSGGRRLDSAPWGSKSPR